MLSKKNKKDSKNVYTLTRCGNNIKSFVVWVLYLRIYSPQQIKLTHIFQCVVNKLGCFDTSTGKYAACTFFVFAFVLLCAKCVRSFFCFFFVFFLFPFLFSLQTATYCALIASFICVFFFFFFSFFSFVFA